MKKLKSSGLQLKDLKIQSFVTSLEPWESKTIKGGSTEVLCITEITGYTIPSGGTGGGSGYSMPIDTGDDPAAVMEPPKHQPSGPC